MAKATQHDRRLPFATATNLKAKTFSSLCYSERPPDKRHGLSKASSAESQNREEGIDNFVNPLSVNTLSASQRIPDHLPATSCPYQAYASAW